MSLFARTIFIGLPALAASLHAAAQAPQPAPAASAPVAPAYRSAFENYRPFAAEEVQDWRRSNDAARDIGGWRAYAREMQGGAQPKAPAASQPKAADPHAGHH
jgi:hypothetical protein